MNSTTANSNVISTTLGPEPINDVTDAPIADSTTEQPRTEGANANDDVTTQISVASSTIDTISTEPSIVQPTTPTSEEKTTVPVRGDFPPIENTSTESTSTDSTNAGGGGNHNTKADVPAPIHPSDVMNGNKTKFESFDDKTNTEATPSVDHSTIETLTTENSLDPTTGAPNQFSASTTPSIKKDEINRNVTADTVKPTNSTKQTLAELIESFGKFHCKRYTF